MNHSCKKGTKETVARNCKECKRGWQQKYVNNNPLERKYLGETT